MDYLVFPTHPTRIAIATADILRIARLDEAAPALEALTRASLDRDLFLWIVDQRVGWLDPLFLAGTIVGYAGLVWIALAAVVAWRQGLSILRTTALVAGTVSGMPADSPD